MEASETNRLIAKATMKTRRLTSAETGEMARKLARDQPPDNPGPVSATENPITRSALRRISIEYDGSPGAEEIESVEASEGDEGEPLED